MQLRWEPAKGKYATGSVYRAGATGVTIGTTLLGFGQRDKPKEPRWVAHVALPGIKQAPAPFHTEEEAKREVERRVEIWFGWMK